MITPTIINNLQWKAYLIFMCTNAAFIPLVYFCYPETYVDWESKSICKIHTDNTFSF